MPFKKLLVIRCLRPDRITVALTKFIRDTLPKGDEFVDMDSKSSFVDVLSSAIKDSEPNTPNNDTGHKKYANNAKVSKFKSLTGEGNDFERKGEAMEEELPSNNHQGMEEEKNGMEIESHDILKQQEEMLKKKMNFIGLSVETKKSHDLKMQIEPKEINSEAKIHHKKSAADTIRHHEFRCLIFSPSISEAVFKRHLTIIYRGLIYARKCLKGPSDNYLKSKQVDLLARKQNSKIN